MYGLVHKSIENLVRSERGAPGWERVARAVGIGSAGIVELDAYPDEATLELVGAAAAELDQTPSDFLELLGERWVGLATELGYGALLELTGRDFLGFVKGLDALHARLLITFPRMQAPEFRAEISGDGHVRVTYASTRDGLAPMVRGLLRGLAGRFEHPAEIVQLESRDDGDEHDVFEIREVAA